MLKTKERDRFGDVGIDPSTTDENQIFENSEVKESETPETAEETNTTETATETKDGSEKPKEETGQDEETATDEAKTDDEKKEDDKPDDPKGFQKRINEITLKRRTAEREAEALKKENEKLRADIEAKKETTAAKETEETPATGKPKEDDFDNYADFMEALSDWKVQGTIAAERKKWEAEKTEETANAEAEKQQQLIDGKLGEGRKKYDDFDKVAMDDVPYSQAMVDVVTDSDDFVEVAYYLGQHLDEADRISRLSPLAAAREIGKIEAQLSIPHSEPTPEQQTEDSTTKKTTNAPAPIKSIKGTEVVNKDPSKMNNAEYEKWRQEGQK